MSGTVNADRLATLSDELLLDRFREGEARAFEELAAPQGPGCACLPTHVVNRVLELKLDAVWDALSLALAR